MSLDATAMASLFAAQRSVFPGIAQHANIDGAWVPALVTRVAAGSIPTEYGIVEGKSATVRVLKSDAAAAKRATWAPATGDVMSVRNAAGRETEYRVAMVEDREYHWHLTMTDKAAG